MDKIITTKQLSKKHQALTKLQDKLNKLQNDDIPDEEQPEVLQLEAQINKAFQMISELQAKQALQVAKRAQKIAELEKNTDAPPSEDSLGNISFANVDPRDPDGPKEPNFDKKMLKEDLLGSKFEGADSEELNKATEMLYNNDKYEDGPNSEEVEAALIEIARLRNLKYETAKEQYEKAKKLRAEAKAKGYGQDLDEERHPDFAGSTTQLRFGKLVGDVHGLDPVFGSLVSPTGGLVGPANGILKLPENFPAEDADNPVVIHGVCHDAGGMLLNVWNKGPGYEYINPTNDTYSKHPLAGQESGINFWADTPEKRAQLGHLGPLKDLGHEATVVANIVENTTTDPKEYAKDVKEALEYKEVIVNETKEKAGNYIDTLKKDWKETGQYIESQVKNVIDEQSGNILADSSKKEAVKNPETNKESDKEQTSANQPEKKAASTEKPKKKETEPASE